MLRWIDPDTGKRKSQSAKTNDPELAETKRGELEYELNHGLHKEASRMSWEKFRDLFEDEYVSGKRQNTRLGYQATFDLFERLCCPTSIGCRYAGKVPAQVLQKLMRRWITT